MRRFTWILLILFVFAIPWEYSLDIGAPLGNIARILGVLTMLAAVPAVLQEGRFRRLSPIHWLTLALYLWFCCTFFWTVAPHETLLHLRGYAQEMMLVWLVWEFVETAGDLQVLLRAWLGGSWLLVILTIAGFVFVDGLAQEQVRFAAIGQDPNDVARLLVFGFPIAVLLADGSKSRLEQALCLMYFPTSFAAILLTASRSGLLLAMVALGGCGIAALRRHSRAVLVATALVALTATGIFIAAPPGTLDRLGTTAEVREYRSLNQRINIWSTGWRAFESAPVTGHGAGSFVTAAKLAPEDTAHNTILSILVESGLCGLSLAAAIVVFAVRAIGNAPARLRFGLYLLMLLWASSSLTGTLWESRTTWLLIGIAAVSERITEVSGSEAHEGCVCSRSPSKARERGTRPPRIRSRFAALI
jgi:O-antigen ligase